MKTFNDNWVTSVFQLLSAALVVCFIVVIILIFSKSKEEVTTIPVADDADYVIIDQGIDIGDRIITFDFEQPRQFILEGKPRMVSPQAVIDFSGDKVTYSGELPVDEAAKVFFDAVMGFVKEARECKNESK